MLTWRKMTQGFQKCRQKLVVSLLSWIKSRFSEFRNTTNKQIGGKGDRTVTKLPTTTKNIFCDYVNTSRSSEISFSQKRKLQIKLTIFILAVAQIPSDATYFFSMIYSNKSL